MANEILKQVGVKQERSDKEKPSRKNYGGSKYLTKDDVSELNIYIASKWGTNVKVN